jgi:trk/ktr system potassium uptake protein
LAGSPEITAYECQRDSPTTVKFLHPIILVLSFVLMASAVMTVPSSLLAMHENGHALHAFLISGCVFLVLSVIGFATSLKRQTQVTSKQLYLITVSSWCMLALTGALPLYLGLQPLSFTDAFFESMSGITTTGSTILAGLDQMPHSLLLWRAILQWVGGIGIVMLGIAILPFLRIGGMKLFATESSDWSGKSMPRAHHLIQNIGIAYVGVSALNCICYYLAGMNLFDAVVHTMSTVSTGGFSNYDASLGHFGNNPAILWVASVFMLLGALPFSLYVSAIRGKAEVLWTDNQVRGLVGFIAVIVLLLTFERVLRGDASFLDSLTQVTFNVISVITTTGYVSQDYTLWGAYAVVVFFYLMFIGGCSGSTAGGIKVFRFHIALLLLRNQLHLMRHPSAIFTTKYNGRDVSDDIIRSIIAFTFYYGFSIATIAFCLSLTGLDFLTSLSASVTAVGNVGPGLGNIVGPSGNFSSLSDMAKWLLAFGMLLGRLEIMTILVLFTRTFWKR